MLFKKLEDTHSVGDVQNCQIFWRHLRAHRARRVIPAEVDPKAVHARGSNDDLLADEVLLWAHARIQKARKLHLAGEQRCKSLINFKLFTHTFMPTDFVKQKYFKK